MEVDYCVPLSEMGAVLKKVLETKEVPQMLVPPEVRAEAEISEKMATGIEVVRSIATPSVYTCPDCWGVLSEIQEGIDTRYRCHTGHSYTAKDLLFKQGHNVEATLWVALRMIEERRNLLHKMERQANQRGFSRFANEHRQKAEDLQQHIEQLKKLLAIVQNGEED